MLIVRARRTSLAAAMLAAALVGVCIWHDQGLLLDYFFPSPPLGLPPDAIAAMVLASLLPALSINSLSVQERLCAGRPKIALALYAILLAMSPGLTSIAWVSAVKVAQPMDADQIPPVLPRACSFAFLGLVGLLLTILLGPLWGPVAALISFGALVAAQGFYGPAVLGGILSTGNRWQTNVWADAILLLTCAILAYRMPSGTARSRGSG